MAKQWMMSAVHYVMRWKSKANKTLHLTLTRPEFDITDMITLLPHSTLAPGQGR